MSYGGKVSCIWTMLLQEGDPNPNAFIRLSQLSPESTLPEHLSTRQDFLLAALHPGRTGLLRFYEVQYLVSQC